ncbi:hypothetical protein LCGC14_1875230 [marine sediment metagenome]|uniref:Uncharacterized protein n=1 Tax=marine sediment metagenome TaxID=412755 RepID=A0A0F9J2J8_9ZZZZ
MTRSVWPRAKDRSGHTFVTVKGVRYRVDGTGHSLAVLLKMVRNGSAEPLIPKGSAVLEREDEDNDVG